MPDKLMHAVQYSSYGGGSSALKHVEIPIPKPKSGEILVKLEATCLNPLDWAIQDGRFRPIMPYKFPCTPGVDISGEVVSVGPGVENFSVGEKIIAMLDLGTGGGFAEFTIVPVKSALKRPPEVSATDGCCLPIAGLTALQAIRDFAGAKLDGTWSKNVLVTAASGGVGVYAVQIAKLTGAHVTATCGARNVELVKSLGADEVLDYKTPEGDALKSPSGRLYDAVIHCASGIPWNKFAANMTANGKLVKLNLNLNSLVHCVYRKLTFSKQQLLLPVAKLDLKDLEILANLHKEGKIKTVIDSRHPLSKAEEAWAKSMEGHATGKVVVTFGD